VPISLRMRLAIWYAALLALILLITSLLSYSYHGAAHYEDVDRSLVATAVHVLGELPQSDFGSTPQGGIEFPPVDEFAAPDVYVRLYDGDGQLLASSPNAGRQPDADPRLVASTPHVREGWPLDWIAHALVSARHLDVFRETRMLSGGQKLSLLDLDQIQVQGDPDRLKQLLLILVDNAIKYTPEAGEIRLTLRLEAGSALVTVSDSGIGIDPEDLPHLFDRFYRADRARARDHGGTGLGLAIAKWIAERHGGQITVESAPGNGTTFSVRLPAVSALSGF
jgi:signal transduction histidine kinase